MQSSGVTVPQSQQLRFAKPSSSSKPILPPKKKREGIFKDHNLKAAIVTRPGWTPNFMTLVRITIIVRFLGAMYGGLEDCDEVFNYWEPLHYLLKGRAFQTWEYSPVYALRSYFYLLLHYLPVQLASRISKRASFFALRLSLATISSLLESLFVLSLRSYLSPHISRYAFFVMLFSPGFYVASTSFLPSSFAMYSVLFAFSFAVAPVGEGIGRIAPAVAAIAVGAGWGWPFVGILGFPLVFEQLFLAGETPIPTGQKARWYQRRTTSLAVGVLAGLALLVPPFLVDSYFYQKWTFMPTNLISYNLFSSSRGVSSTLYGTAPLSYYISSLLLSFNFLFPLSLLSLPALLLTTYFDPKRLGDLRDRSAGQTHPTISAAVRLIPFYLWLGTVGVMDHKEERFLYPVYPLLVMNGCTTLYLARGWAEQIYLKSTKSLWKTTQTPLFSRLTLTFILLSTILSLSRTISLHSSYHAPLTIYHHFQTYELPRVLLSLHPSLSPSSTLSASLPPKQFREAISKAEVEIPLEVLGTLGLRLCIGKEWHRFPGSWLVDDVVETRWVKSDFRGILPRNWESQSGKLETDLVPDGMNEFNKEELDRYVDVETCDYLVDLDFPHRLPHLKSEDSLEPRYAVMEGEWERVRCEKFLDNEESLKGWRSFYVPGMEGERGGKKWGDYCLLRRRGSEKFVVGKE